MSSEHGTHLQVAVLRQKNLAQEAGCELCQRPLLHRHQVQAQGDCLVRSDRPGPKAPEPHEDVVVAAATLINSDTLSRHSTCAARVAPEGPWHFKQSCQCTSHDDPTHTSEAGQGMPWHSRQRRCCRAAAARGAARRATPARGSPRWLPGTAESPRHWVRPAGTDKE